MKNWSVFANILCFNCFSWIANKKGYEEIDSFILDDEKVEAGKHLRLIHLKEGMLSLKGTGFYVNKFNFDCGLVAAIDDMHSLYKDVIAIDLSSGKMIKTLKYVADKFEHWPPNTMEKEVAIDFPILPGETYTGKGYFYFYLINKDNHRVSNIIKLRIRFE